MSLLATTKEKRKLTNSFFLFCFHSCEVVQVDLKRLWEFGKRVSGYEPDFIKEGVNIKLQGL